MAYVNPVFCAACRPVQSLLLWYVGSFSEELITRNLGLSYWVIH